jgi:hypothetical protein
LKIRGLSWAACAAALVFVAASACDDNGNITSLQCPAGSTVCGDASPACVNLKGDPSNCGACGHACVHGQICDLGSCVGNPSDGSVVTMPTPDAGPDAPADAPREGASDATPDAVADSPHDAPGESAPADGSGDVEQSDGGGNG